MTWTVGRAIGLGTGLAAIGVVVAWALLPAGAVAGGYAGAEFARRWDGGCTGWTRDLALLTVAADVGQWWAYITVAVIFHSLHPTPLSVRTSRASVLFTSLFFVGCGFGHLLDAYSVFHPVYWLRGVWVAMTSAVAIPASWLIATSLVRAFAESEARRRELERLRRSRGTR